MIEQDTIRLLRECDAGIKMGISAIDDTLKYVSIPELKQLLEKSRKDNEEIQKELTELLHDYHDAGKDPNPMAKGMSWIKTNVKLSVDDSDSAAAELITDGCNMGVKSLSRYLNQYKAADERSKKIAKRLISIEERLAADLRVYL